MDTLHILHIEDDAAHAELVRYALTHSGLDCKITLAMSRAECMAALHTGKVDVVLSDNSGYDFEGLEILHTVRKECPGIPFFLLSGTFDGKNIAALKAAGVTECLLKSELERIVPAIRRAIRHHAVAPEHGARSSPPEMERLVTVIQELSLARNLQSVQDIVRRAARELTGADGATFVLREGDQCYYADEDAIAPLWKGQRFPMSACISGWTMQHREAAIIEDIYADNRIPHDAYRPTFVRSLVMVPIRTLDPIGAIGNYWATNHQATEEEVRLLRALADTTAVALENVHLYENLEQKIRDRTRELEAANRELEAFSYSVSHDLRGPLHSISGFGKILRTDYRDRLDDAGQKYLAYIDESARHMTGLIDALLGLAKVARAELQLTRVDMSELVRQIAAKLRRVEPQRHCEFLIADNITASGDSTLLQIVLANLVGNAWKFSARRDPARIEFGVQPGAGSMTYFVRDNGAGFDMRHAGKLFMPFQRQHREHEFEGSGIGLATVQRIINRHGGKIWADAAPDQGATFYFTLAPNT